MQWYDPILYPFSWLYDGVTRVRNLLFDMGIKRSRSFQVPTIVVGNLNVGGSGKTPMVEYLIEIFKGSYDMAVLSRGYGRRTKGFLMAGDLLGPDELGDEPYQIYSKYGKEVQVVVGEKRTVAIPLIMQKKPFINLILLDDAYQHRYVKGDFNLLLTTYQKPFFKDKMLPVGRLRERAEGADRADVVVVTKCPLTMSENERGEYSREISKYTKASVLFAGINYAEPFAIDDRGGEMLSKAVLVSGIADDHLFVQQAKQMVEIVEKITFDDHHRYKVQEIQRIREIIARENDCMILTTEKDAVKLKSDPFRELLSEIPIFALPIKVQFVGQGHQTLIKKINSVIKEKDYIREA